ncbi:hypothetical protein M433DRAFT_452594, partial [Acidomyces richmondensis BFW]
SSSSFVRLISSISARSFSHFSVKAPTSSCLSFKSCSSFSLRSFDATSLSFRKLSSSIWMVMISLSSFCMASGLLSCCSRNAEAASSTRSMALSGKKRSVMYRLL